MRRGGRDAQERPAHLKPSCAAERLVPVGAAPADDEHRGAEHDQDGGGDQVQRGAVPGLGEGGNATSSDEGRTTCGVVHELLPVL